MMLVIVPSGLLIIESADSGGMWWPWALAGASWAVLVTTGSVLFWVWMIKRGRW